MNKQRYRFFKIMKTNNKTEFRSDLDFNIKFFMYMYNVMYTVQLN